MGVQEKAVTMKRHMFDSRAVSSKRCDHYVFPQPRQL